MTPDPKQPFDKALIAAIVGALFLAACAKQSDRVPGGETELSGRVDSCDLRKVTGTCVEYTMNELDDWYRENLVRICPTNSRGDLVGIYRVGFRCPAKDRVARCEGMIENPAERYEYDKHYYAGTADGFSWGPENVRVTCEQQSGNFVPE